MAQEALSVFAGGSSPERVEALKQQAREILAVFRAGPDGTGDAFATVVFDRGQTATDIEQFAAMFGLEVCTAQAKFPMGDDGQVMTLSTGLTLFDGIASVSQALRMSMGSMQLQMLETANRIEDDQRERFLDVANVREPSFYQIEVIGRAPELQQAMESDGVAAVLIEPTGVKLRGARAAQAQVAEMRRLAGPPVLRRLEDGPPPGVTPDRILPFPFPIPLAPEQRGDSPR